MPWAEDWKVGLNLTVGPVAFPTTGFQFLLILKTACLISDFRWINTELKYQWWGQRVLCWCYREALSLGSSGANETLRFFRVSCLSLNLTVCQCRRGGRRRQFVVSGVWFVNFVGWSGPLCWLLQRTHYLQQHTGLVLSSGGLNRFRWFYIGSLPC